MSPAVAGTPSRPPGLRLDDALAVVAGRFFRREVRVRTRACLSGMLSGRERKTSWSLAADVEPEEVEALAEADNTRLVLVSCCS